MKKTINIVDNLNFETSGKVSMYTKKENLKILGSDFAKAFEEELSNRLTKKNYEPRFNVNVVENEEKIIISDNNVYKNESDVKLTEDFLGRVTVYLFEKKYEKINYDFSELNQNLLNCLLYTGETKNDLLNSVYNAYKRIFNEYSFVYAFEVKDSFNTQTRVDLDTKDMDALNPKPDPEFIESKNFISLAKTVDLALQGKVNVKNILLKGPAGTGKSSLVREIAARFEMPYVVVSSTPDMTTEDFLGGTTAVPAVKPMQVDDYQKIKAELIKRLKVRDDISDEVMLPLFMKEREMGLSGKKLRFKLSQFAQALKYGGIVEIQEPTIIRNPAVIAGLNSILQEGVFVADRTPVERHKNCIIFFTTNVSYEGCRQMNQSVLDRMDITKTINFPSRDEIVEIVKKRTPLKDDEKISKMLDVVKSMMVLAREENITDGEIGLRSLISWANLFSLEHYDMTESFKDAVLEKATSDEDDKTLLMGVFENSELFTM